MRLLLGGLLFCTALGCLSLTSCEGKPADDSKGGESSKNEPSGEKESTTRVQFSYDWLPEEFAHLKLLESDEATVTRVFQKQEGELEKGEHKDVLKIQLVRYKNKELLESSWFVGAILDPAEEGHRLRALTLFDTKKELCAPFFKKLESQADSMECSHGAPTRTDPEDWFLCAWLETGEQVTMSCREAGPGQQLQFNIR